MMSGKPVGGVSLIVRGAVLTMNAVQPWAESFAVSGCKIVAVGDEADIAALAGPRTTVIDAGDGMVMPGLIDVNAHVGFGGPSAARVPDPWRSIENMVTGRGTDPAFPATPAPAQALNLVNAIAAYTVNAARAAGLADVTGQLSPGLSADFIILPCSLFSVPVDLIHATRVRETWFCGRIVHQATDSVTDLRPSTGH